MSSVDAFLLDRTKIPRELHNAHFFLFMQQSHSLAIFLGNELKSHGFEQILANQAVGILVCSSFLGRVYKFSKSHTMALARKTTDR
jgi:hypothetical protein